MSTLLAAELVIMRAAIAVPFAELPGRGRLR